MQTKTEQFLTPVHIEAFDLDDVWLQNERTLKKLFNADKRKSNADYADKFNLRPSAFRDV